MKIYHVAKKQNLGLFQLQDMVRYQNLTERRLGSLPFDWFKNVKTAEYFNVTKDVDTFLKEFSEQSSNPELETLDKISASLVKKLKKVLQRDDIKMEYIDNGYYKECSKLTIGDFSYAILTFFEKFGMHSGDERTFGKYFEPQAIFFTYKKMQRHGRMAKPFMSRFSTDYFEYGYMLNKFIEETDTKRAKTLLNPLRDDYYEYSIPDSFGRGNMINNIIIDAGGIIKNKTYIKDKDFRRKLFVFLDRIYIDTLRFFAKNNSDLKLTIMEKADVENYLCEQLDNGVDIYSADLRKLLKSFNEQQQIYGKRRIRQLRNTHKLKNELKANGTYNEYKPYLEKAADERNMRAHSITHLLSKELEIPLY